MNSKKDILNAWIMCEHLNEGQIDSKPHSFEYISDNNYYDAIRAKFKKNMPRNAGIIVYFDFFKFSEIIEIIRSKYKIKKPVEESVTGSKFALAVGFDLNFDLVEDKTFLTKSAYIKKKKSLPEKEAFNEYEESRKEQVKHLFAHDNNITEEERKVLFNEAMTKLVRIMETSPDKCRFLVVDNLESGTNNLHSFYIDDLEIAKKTDTQNLRDYLNGYSGTRTDLDSKKDSPKFNAKIFEDILSPMNFPLGRFPSETKYPLSFMQQAAVDLAIGYDNRTIRSVNGPPGSGKTTLLKDIFAELVVKQSYALANLSGHTIRGGIENKYDENYTIGELPDEIAQNNIVVASSNNGAVQNIVNELPLINMIDKKLIDQLKEADYFYEISNSLKGKKSTEEDKNWGLFSMEGGKAENMSTIRSAVDSIYEYLKSEYISDPGIYKTFLEEYKKVEALRNRAAEYADEYKTVYAYRNAYEKKSADLAAKRSKKENGLNELTCELKEKTASYNKEHEDINSQLEEIRSQREELKFQKEQLEERMELISKNKPNLFAAKSIKDEYKQLSSNTKQELSSVQHEDKELEYKELVLTQKLEANYRSISQLKDKIAAEERKLSDLIRENELELDDMRSKADGLWQELSVYPAQPLDMTLEYEQLQMSSPWFDEEYRIAQSKLFITALRARKQFLFDNKNNILAAKKIWENQKKYQDNKRLIEIAWNWINFAIPVISSTFASFRSMCKNLGENSLGRLFVDEAGQALPYAAVGAVFRSRHIMMVGDPSQIRPVQTLDAGIMNMFGRHFGVSEKYLSVSASAQTLADAASQYGYSFDGDRWIGIPLWVHRRCDYPMFTIANEISYSNMMVQGNKNYGKTGWFDIKGKANNKYVGEQGEFLVKKLLKMQEEDKDIFDKIYIITPFKNVAKELAQRLDKIGFTKKSPADNGKVTNIGTIHTFQGKEAPIVFMVLGADDKSKGAANWAVYEPNMMNAAVTRAKKEFYIVGDKELYRSLNSKVANATIKIIDDYRNEHPDLVDENIMTEEITQISPPVITGAITTVRRGKTNYYAYIKGSDERTYTVNETMYGMIANADKLIVKGGKVKFTPKQNSSGTTLYATNISKA